MINSVLVATDGSEHGAIAIEYGISLARRLSAELRGLTVIDIKIIQGPLFDDLSGFMGVAPSQEFVSLIEKSLNERADGILKEFDEKCLAEGVRPILKKRMGVVDDVIVEEGQDADLIILAQKGEHYLLTKRGLLGSTTESVIRKSTKPVLVTPLEYRTIGRIGIAYDGSEPAGRALDAALDVSKLTGWSVSAVVITDEAARAADVNGQLNEACGKRGMQCPLSVRAGKDEQEILDFADGGAVDLLVMGAYGRSRIRELILGSTTTFVIRRSSIPVLLVR
ncbi:MAG: universal stress protein [Deltaproteobacteria bacterium]|nr:universal stress protein [Deltaproteobacteria bacterium]